MLTSQVPAELTKLIDPERDVEEYRNVFCEHYDGCLDEVVSKGWMSWTCARCPLFSGEVGSGLIES